jgi:RNA polymerase sigma-70 factor (ECF subfamily)
VAPQDGLRSSGHVPAPGPNSFDALFRAHAPYVLRVLPRLGVAPADLEDVCQEVFVVVHRMLPTFEGRSALKTWIYGIALRVARSHRRRAYRRREIPTEQLPEAGNAYQSGPCPIERSQELALLDEALEQLSEAQRELIVLFEIEELSVAEVAQATATSKFTIYSRLYAARRTLERHVHRKARLRSKP